MIKLTETQAKNISALLYWLRDAALDKLNSDERDDVDRDISEYNKWLTPDKSAALPGL